MGIYIRLIEYKSSDSKEIEFFNKRNWFNVENQHDFSKIPGLLLAYWTSPLVRNLFLNKKINDKYIPRQGMATTDNERFLRFWFEIIRSKIDFGGNSDSYEWFPYNKGGSYRKWFGNNEYIVHYENNGKVMIDLVTQKYPKISDPEFVIKNRKYYFSQGITWSALSSGNLGARFTPSGYIFDTKGPMFFIENNEELYYLLVLLNTKVAINLLKILAPTLDFNPGAVGNLVFLSNKKDKDKINILVIDSIKTAKNDWNSRETSWDFKQNELIRLKTLDGSIKSTIVEYQKYWTEEFFQLNKNEEELNKIFIEIYGLQDELTPNVPLSDITILKDELSERNEEAKTLKFDELVLIKQFISYSVGCMVGRYSLDVEGLVYAGGEFDSSKYKTFNADKDGIIPILSDDRFDDDITARFKEFVKVVFGEKNYSTNIDYIANVLGRKDDETAIECIRRYFLNDFYKDHVKMYKKRPIYWLYSSGKEKGFNAIVYMHRYKKETISILRMDYLHKLQRSYDLDYETAERQEKSTSDSKQKIQLQKRMIYLKAVLQELKKYDELLRHYADKQVEIDLDDGVVVNYDKFKELLVKI